MILILEIVGASSVTAAAIPGVIGFRWNTSDSSPRLYQIDSDGNVIPNATGDWFNTHLPWSGMKTVVVNASNSTQVLYGTNNRGDGLDLSGAYGDVMVEIPRFYTCSTYANGNFSYWISPDPQDALHYTVHPMFYQRGTGADAGRSAPYIYVGRYASNNGGSSKPQSATGKSPWVSNTLNSFRTYAANKGAGWGVSNIWTYSAIRQLFFTEMVTLDSQTAWSGSRGNVDSGATMNSGADSIDTAIFAMNATGNGTGAYGKTPVSYRGLENLWGNLWLFHDGFTATTTDTRVINATGLGLTGQATTFAVPIGGNDYQSVGTISTASGKWQINLMNTDAARPLFFTSVANNAGSQTTYLSDYYWAPTTTSTSNPDVLITGGDWTGSGYAGISYLDISQALSFTATNRGMRLEFRFNAPEAGFSSANTSVATNTTSQGWAGREPFTMQFTDTSTNSPTGWKWARNNLTSADWTVFNTSQNAQDRFWAGNWSVNLTATNTGGTGISSQTLWVNVSHAAPTVTGIAPSSGQNSTGISITNLAGTGFYGTPTVNLTRTGYSDITASGVTVVSSSNVTCTFDLTNRITGTWNVSITNPDGQQAALLNGFTITNTSAPTPTPTPYPTPTSSGGGDVGTVQRQLATASGSGISIASGAQAGQTVTYSFGEPSADYPVSIEGISFVPDQAVGQSQCLISHASPAEGFTIPDRPSVYETIQINWINPNVMSKAAIQFSVKGSWMREHNVEPQDIVMMRQHNLVWAEIPTVYDHVTNDIYYFTSTTPGFSNFAVSVRKNVTTMVIANATSIQTPVASLNPPGATTTIATIIPTGVPVSLTSPTPAPATQPETGIPVAYIVGGIAIIMLGVAGFFFGRRWWWKRQNPNLFRKFD